MGNGNKGITLVALVVTIVILLILAGITIELTLGSDGIIQKTKFAKNQSCMQSDKEAIQIAYSTVYHLYDKVVTAQDLQEQLTYDGKDAECETGLMVRVPLFIEQGETIIISTADGKYVSRA